MLVSGALSIVFRLALQRNTLSPKTFAFWIYALSLVPSIFLSRYLERIGSPRNDPTTGTLISSGEDLSRPGILEWCFDVVYVTCETDASNSLALRSLCSAFVKGCAKLAAVCSAHGSGGCIWS